MCVSIILISISVGLLASGSIVPRSFFKHRETFPNYGDSVDRVLAPKDDDILSVVNPIQLTLRSLKNNRPDVDNTVS